MYLLWCQSSFRVKKWVFRPCMTSLQLVIVLFPFSQYFCSKIQRYSPESRFFIIVQHFGTVVRFFPLRIFSSIARNFNIALVLPVLKIDTQGETVSLFVSTHQVLISAFIQSCYFSVFFRIVALGLKYIRGDIQQLLGSFRSWRLIILTCHRYLIKLH